MGSKLITKEALDAGDYAAIGRKVADTVALIRKVRGG
jgi:2-keto-3-deoxy-6-phosphogluconate aldolase